MSDRNMAMTLAKVLIAAAWVDGNLDHEEINSLKDLLFRFPRQRSDTGFELTANEWAELDIYIHSPVGSTERIRLIEQLQGALRKPEDRALVISALEDLVQADGEVTTTEQAVLGEIRAAMKAVDLNIFAQLKRLLTGPIERRTQTVSHAPNREAYLEDFIKNRIYYSVRQRLALGETELDLAESELRRLSLAGGMMARVARIDQGINQHECDMMIQTLQTIWGISHEAATLVAEVAASEVSAELDYHRMTREFMELTSYEERVRFLDVLFDVANADGQVTRAEEDEIRHLAHNIYLSQEQFIQAKLKMSHSG